MRHAYSSDPQSSGLQKPLAPRQVSEISVDFASPTFAYIRLRLYTWARPLELSVIMPRRAHSKNSSEMAYSTQRLREQTYFKELPIHTCVLDYLHTSRTTLGSVSVNDSHGWACSPNSSAGRVRVGQGRSSEMSDLWVSPGRK